MKRPYAVKKGEIHLNVYMASTQAQNKKASYEQLATNTLYLLIKYWLGDQESNLGS